MDRRIIDGLTVKLGVVAEPTRRLVVVGETLKPKAGEDGPYIKASEEEYRFIGDGQSIVDNWEGSLKTGSEGFNWILMRSSLRNEISEEGQPRELKTMLEAQLAELFGDTTTIAWGGVPRLYRVVAAARTRFRVDTGRLGVWASHQPGKVVAYRYNIDSALSSF